jgi:hypothetical protein
MPDILADIVYCWELAKAKGYNPTPAEFVTGYLVYRHNQAAEESGRFSQDLHSVETRRQRWELKARGICTYCWRRPIYRERSSWLCKECFEKYKEKKAGVGK